MRGLGVVLPLLAAYWSQAQAQASGFLVNTRSGKCLDCAPATLGARTTLGLFDCETDWSGTDQVWRLARDGFIVNTLTGLCVDVDGSPGTTPGLAIFASPCERVLSATDQTWTLDAYGRVVNQLSGKCLGVAGAGTSGDVQLAACNPAGSLLDQQWQWSVLTATDRAGSGFLVNPRSGLCLNPYGNPCTTNGCGITLEICRATVEGTLSDQSWRLTPAGFLLNTLSGRCLDVVGGASTLDLFDCEFSTANTDQKWSLDQYGRIVNELSKNCVGVEGAGTVAGNKLELAGCKSPGVTDQYWVWSNENQVPGYASTITTTTTTSMTTSTSRTSTVSKTGTTSTTTTTATATTSTTSTRSNTTVDVQPKGFSSLAQQETHPAGATEISQTTATIVGATAAAGGCVLCSLAMCGAYRICSRRQRASAGCRWRDWWGQAPGHRKLKVMFSGSFDGGDKEKRLRATAKELQKLGAVEVLEVTAGAGQTFGGQGMTLDQADVIIAMACESYGEQTQSAYSSFTEVDYMIANQKYVIPVKLYDGPWPPTPGGEADVQNMYLFRPDLVYIDGKPSGKFLRPAKLATKINEALNKYK